MMKKFGIFKMVGTFGTILMIAILFGPTLIELGHAAKTGEWSGMLTVVGGRIFVIEHTINQETNYLLEDTDDPVYRHIFSLVYIFTLIFMIFFAAYLLFLFMNWLSGKGQLTPSTDIIIICIIILAFLGIEFAYSYFILDTTVIPIKDGIFYFFKNLPTIFNNLIS